MEPLTLELPHGDDEAIECWDEDGELQCNDDFQFPPVSRATSVTNSSVRRSGHRDSISSRLSARSDLDSNVGGDEDWEVDLHENDERVNQEAVSSAKNAGIPLPANVPKSALVGGTIKRLGGKKPKKDFMHDWAEDLELPNPDDVLEVKSHSESTFPESLRQVSSTAASPVKSRSPLQNWDDDFSPQMQPAITKLSDFRDDDEIEGLQSVPTIKVPRPRSPQKTTPPSDSIGKADPEVENFDQDFELPADNSPLKLPPRKANRRTPSPTPEDFDVDWCEGSIGVRFGGTKRDRPSNTSSSISVVSPSISSCLSGSDDDGLEGLILPDGPLSLDASLKKQQDPKSTGPSDQPAKLQPSQESDNADDFFSGIEVDGGNVFTGKKLPLNPNVKCKAERPWSPVRRSATSITFTDGTGSPKTRIPRPSGHAHSHSTSLETVSESGAPPSKFRGIQPRAGDHSHSSSVSSLPRSGPTSLPTRFTSNRRPVGARAAQGGADDSVGRAGRHMLKSKRSMPAMRSSHQAPSTEPPQCPPSLHQGVGRSLGSPGVRSFMPPDRMGNGTKLFNRRFPAPSVPAGGPGSRSQHATIKSYSPSSRKNSDSSSDMFSSQGSVSRASRLNRNRSFGTSASETSPESVLNATKQSLSKPPRRRNFGDGTELESFDDLPTSSFTENRFMKNPAGRGAPRSLRTRLSISQNPQPRGETPSQPQTPRSALQPPDSTPRFARDTNASRNAREQRIGSMTMTLKGREGNTPTSLNTNLKAPTTSRAPSSPTLTRKRKTKSSVLPGTKPHLIKPMGNGVQEAKCELPPFQAVILRRF